MNLQKLYIIVAFCLVGLVLFSCRNQTGNTSTAKTSDSISNYVFNNAFDSLNFLNRQIKTIDSLDELNNLQTDTLHPFNGDGFARLYRIDKQISKYGIFRKYKMSTGKCFVYNKQSDSLEQIGVYFNANYIGNENISEEIKKRSVTKSHIPLK